MEGSSRRAHTTVYSRGTRSYRAPELIRDNQAGRYTNKVDMWAVGCILYELVLRRRLFRDDWEVQQYASLGGEREISVGADSIPDERKREFILKVIKELLNVDPMRRPRAKDLYERFISWGSDTSAKQIGAVMQSPSNALGPNSDPSIASSEPGPTLPLDYAPPSIRKAPDISRQVPNALRPRDGGDFLPANHDGFVSDSSSQVPERYVGLTSPQADGPSTIPINGTVPYNDSAVPYNAAVERTRLQNFIRDAGYMDQMKYSKLLYPMNYGIALRNPSDDISVGDLCFWDRHGKAMRILNIFENQEVCLSHSTMRLSLVS
jgi:serine/threonine protein kinase